LGHPTPIKNYGTVVIVAGGLGTAEMLPIARACKEAGNYIISIVGARRADLLILVEEMSELSDEIIITTDDGSRGRKGVVTEPLKELIEKGKVDFVVTCGPVIMMKFVAQITKEKGIPTLASLNPIMVDGTGMCGACRVSVGGETKFACVDGPDFDAHLVDFDELMMRQKMFTEFEANALKKWLQENRERIPPEHPILKLM
jgi:ferredoxin--NADP+ reductase